MPNQTPQPSAPQAGRAILTIIGSDRVGIIAGIANVLATPMSISSTSANR